MTKLLACSIELLKDDDPPLPWPARTISIHLEDLKPLLTGKISYKYELLPTCSAHIVMHALLLLEPAVAC